MPKSITAIPERCVGCKLCQLICSYITFRVFNPSRAHLTIKANEKKGRFDIEFLPECTLCGACVKYCPSEALIRDASLSDKEIIDG